jgi:hypothetical protein
MPGLKLFGFAKRLSALAMPVIRRFYVGRFREPRGVMVA